MLRPALIHVALSLSVLLLAGCHQEDLKANDPEIFIANRANAKENASTPFKYKSELNFPKIDSKGGNYWIIFVDQNPCEPAVNPRNTREPDPVNQKAYMGSPSSPPHCLIRLHPDDFKSSAGRTRDLYFRYAVWFERDHLHDSPTPPTLPPPGGTPPVGPPTWELPYRSVPCNPVCD